MRIETQLSTDENLMHFYPETKLNIKNSSEFSDAKSVRRSPLAECLFDLGGIKSVLITPDCISVVKEINVDWAELKPQILAEIMDFLVSGAQIVLEEDKLDIKELEHKINGLLDARIRPAIQKDGGDIEIKKIEDGIIYVQLQGKCVGCPYAQRTLKDGVERLIKTYIPEIRAVEKYEE